MSEEKSEQSTVSRRTLLKIVILGDSTVGKTALSHQYVDNKFMEVHQATIGADLLTKNVTVDGTTVSLQIWDTAGQERFNALGSTYYRGADACIFVYDINNKESFQHINQWRSSFINHASDPAAPDFKFLLLGNKNDVDASLRQVKESEGKQYAESNQMIFFETSAKRGTNVNEAFEALIREIATVEGVPLYSKEVAERIKMVELEMDAKLRKENANCAC